MYIRDGDAVCHALTFCSWPIYCARKTIGWWHSVAREFSLYSVGHVIGIGPRWMLYTILSYSVSLRRNLTIFLQYNRPTVQNAFQTKTAAFHAFFAPRINFISPIKWHSTVRYKNEDRGVGLNYHEKCRVGASEEGRGEGIWNGSVCPRFYQNLWVGRTDVVGLSFQPPIIGALLYSPVLYKPRQGINTKIWGKSCLRPQCNATHNSELSTAEHWVTQSDPWPKWPIELLTHDPSTHSLLWSTGTFSLARPNQATMTPQVDFSKYSINILHVVKCVFTNVILRTANQTWRNGPK